MALSQHLELRQDSEKLGKFLGQWNRETETAGHHDQAIYSQVQMVTRAEDLAGGKTGTNEDLAPR